MLRVASNALIVPPFECAWLSLDDYNLEGACCLQFECKGENDVTIILKPFPGAKRWQHLQRQQGPAGGEHLAVEQNYTVILGSHRNSKLKVERNGDEKASATGLPGCTVGSQGFTTCWINYHQGSISFGTGTAGTSMSFHWQDPEPAIPNIRYIGLSCWDKHVSYRNVQVLPPIAAAQLQQPAEHQRELQQQLLQQQQQRAVLAGQQQQQQLDEQQSPASQNSRDPAGLQGLAWTPAAAAAAATAGRPQQQLHQGHHVPPLLQVAMDVIAASLAPTSLFHVLHLSELLLPRTQQLYEAAVQLAGRCFRLLTEQHLDEFATLSIDVVADILREPLLDVPELSVFEAVAAWCQHGSNGSSVPADCRFGSLDTGSATECSAVAAAADVAEPATGVADALEQIQAQQQQSIQQQQQPPKDQSCLDVCERRATSLPAAETGPRSAADMHELLQLVRFAFMRDEEKQVVLQHPFTKRCSLVHDLMQEDLQRFQDHNGASSSPRGAYTFEQRRLVRPAAASTAPAGNSIATATAAADSAVKQQSQLGQLSQTAATASSQAALMGLTNPVLASTFNRSGSLNRSGSNSSCGRVLGWRPYRRRLAPSCKELMYVCDGDRNGVIRYIGTEYGTKQWVNPVASKALSIKASSPPSRYTDPKAVVSGQFLNTSFAGPRYIRAAAQPSTREPAAAAAAAGSSSTPSTWWQLDLGPQHRLLCNYYTIRHDGSQDGFVRNWVLQGSIDQQHWVDLRRHTSDATIRLPGQYGSWPITGPAASMPFRAFRLLLLGPTHSPTNPWAFCLSYWELYGYFYKLAGETALASIADAKQQEQHVVQQQQQRKEAALASIADANQQVQQYAVQQQQQQQQQQRKEHQQEQR